MQDNTIKETPKLQNAKTLLEDAFSEYRGHMQEGDIEAIAKDSKQSIRTVKGYIAGNVLKVTTGQEIFKALRNIVLKRIAETKKLVA